MEEGCTVTVLAPEREEAFSLDSQAERKLLVAIAEADHSRTISDGELLNRLRDRI